MAEAAILQFMLENLTSLIKDEIGLITSASDERDKLNSNLTAIKAVLADAEKQQLESEGIRDWLRKLRDLVYEIEDILDECATHVSKSKHMSGIRPCHAYSLKKILVKSKIGRRIKQVNEKLDVVAAERREFNLRSGGDLEGPSEIAAARETGSILNDTNHVYGRDKEKEEIVDILVNREKQNPKISILPVIGLGGLGKTTLAQLVRQDPRIVEHFDRILWICVAENFDHKTLIEGMIESVTGEGSASDLVLLDTLEGQLKDLLIHKRFLLVLDDVWNDDQEKWFKLRDALSCGTPGSSIIVTTRMKKVAKIMGTLPPRCLEGLSDDHCWMLLKERAFGCDDDNQHSDLHVIGNQIVKKCAGVPLAAKALGGLLRFKRDPKEWENVRDSKIWDLPEKEDMILPSLLLSYRHLPSHLKRCFAYCAIFPKGSRIYKEKLIPLWVSHGYISSIGTWEAEDVGDHVWKELILRSIFQTSIEDGECIILHDLLHDLAQFITEDKIPGAQPGMTFSPSASNNKIREVNFSELYMAFPKSTLTEMDVSSILKKYNRLRVLNLRGQSLPSTIDSLIHLRYLVLSGSMIRKLPNSLCRLWNLQLLNLNGCTRLQRFPKKMKYLKNVRYLLLEGCSSLRETPSTVRKLTSLRTLSQFIVGCSEGHRLEELECLKNLGGKLEIRHLERVENSIDAKKAKLVEKHNLSDLKLEWEVKNASSDIRGEAEDEKVLEALEFHPNVNRLSISGFCGRHFPTWMKNSMIVRVSIYDCEKLMDVSPLEELQHLEFLWLSDLATVEYIGEGGNAMQTYFPALKQLVLSSLPNLRRFFKEEIGLKMCPRLEELSVSGCPSLTISPLITSLNELNKFDWDKSLVPSFQYFDNQKKLVVRIGQNMMRIRSELLERYKNKMERLEIDGAHESCMPAEGLRRLHSLWKLEIVKSEKLTCLPMGWFDENTTLISIKIKDCPEFEEISEESIKHLQSLTGLVLEGLPKMACLPKSIRHLSSLECLIIAGLPQLTSLPDWLGDLTSLEDLRIEDCPKLASLPDSIKRMTQLTFLVIKGCRNLERRCKEGEGEDWHKIAHIRWCYIGE